MASEQAPGSPSEENIPEEPLGQEPLPHDLHSEATGSATDELQSSPPPLAALPKRTAGANMESFEQTPVREQAKATSRAVSKDTPIPAYKGTEANPAVSRAIRAHWTSGGAEPTAKAPSSDPLKANPDLPATRAMKKEWDPKPVEETPQQPEVHQPQRGKRRALQAWERVRRYVNRGKGIQPVPASSFKPGAPKTVDRFDEHHGPFRTPGHPSSDHTEPKQQ